MATYRLIRKLAAGGMAEVFLAKVVGAEGFEKPVAVKRILPSLAQDREFVELFLREAKLTVCLQHANVVQVFDLGAINGQYYMVMEFVDGENLRAVQRGSASHQVPLGLREVCFIVQQVTEGLAYAHGRSDAAGRPLNIIHRDVNPSNVMVASSGEVKLADFGIAKAANAQNGTQVGVVKGKAGYLAPEQVKGAEVDQRADLFLIGLMLYELLAGKQLFGGTDYFQTLRNIAQFDVKALSPLPGVPPALWSIVTRALAENPTARFQRARDISDALQNFLFDHRLRVGPQDVAALFSRCFPDRHSPLEGSGEVRGEEIRLGSDAGMQRPPTLTSVRSRPPFPGGPRPGTPSIPSMRSVGDAGRTQPPPPPPEARAGTSVTMQVPPPAGARAMTLSGVGPSSIPHVSPTGARSMTMSAVGSSVAMQVPTRVMRTGRRKLGEMLVAAGKLSESQLKGALERQKRTGGRIGELLVAEGILTDEDVVRALSEQGGIAFVSDKVLRTMPVPKGLLALLPLEKAERLEAVPVAQQSKELVCAMREPRDLARLDELKFITGCPVRGIYATEGAIRRAIGRFYRGDDPDQMDDWSNMMPLAGSETQAGVTPYADKHTRTRERLLDESAFEEVSAVPAPPPLPPPPVPEPAPRPPPTLAPASLARTMLVVSDDEELREAAVRLLTRQGVAASGSSAADVEKAVALGGTEVALVAADTVPDAPSLVARLMTVAPSMEVRVLPSLAEALGGEAGPLGRAARLHARVVDAALAELGGVGVQGAALAKLARRVARRLGAGRAEAERASAVAYALALAACQESEERFSRPSRESVRAILGRDAGELAGLIGACTRDAPPLSDNANRATLALAAAVSLLEVAGTATPVASAASQSLVKLRTENRLPAVALEALSAEVMELVLGESAAHTVVLAEPNTARASALQARFLADGVRVVLADSAARARTLLAQGSQALVVASQLPDGDGAALTRSLRSSADTASLPIFVLAPPEDPGLVEAGLDAGADDVLMYPVNPDVLVAKLRRALQPRRAAVVPAPVVLASASVSA
ncbi:protein kinase [Archangium violaceum]|uniref:protein kinase domain-containing protein n=1 Tax=Archangium violaceum TaxID=83451 RepID=UPI00195053A6|nr:protein kinase [Archangium violaceum]QRN96243.1 protein kinase [Archangium violaceum]